METKKLGDFFSGKGRESIPDVGFKAMTLIMKLMDVLGGQSRKNFKTAKWQEKALKTDICPFLSVRNVV